MVVSSSRVRFGCAVLGMWWVFVSVGTLIPLLPLYATRELGSGDGIVGTAILVYAVASVLARPPAGLWLRSHDPWVLLVGSALVGAVALAATPLVHELAWLLALRFVDGVAVGLFYMAAATSVVQDSSVERRGRALSYFSVPLFLGVAVGPVIGDWLIDRVGYDLTWVIAGATMAVAIVPSAFPMARPTGGSRIAKHAGVSRNSATPSDAELADPVSARDVWRTLAHPAAVWPAAIITLIVSGWAAFQAYVPLYGSELGMSGTGTVFLLYSAIVLAIRIAGAPLFDTLPQVELVVLASIANLAGLVVVSWWTSVAALYLGAGLMAVASALSYTTLLRIALRGVTRREQASVVGTYSISWDIGTGIGAAALGGLVAWRDSYPAAFVGGAVAAVLALVMTLRRFWPQRSQYRMSGVGGEPAAVSGPNSP